MALENILPTKTQGPFLVAPKGQVKYTKYPSKRKHTPTYNCELCHLAT